MNLTLSKKCHVLALRTNVGHFPTLCRTFANPVSDRFHSDTFQPSMSDKFSVPEASPVKIDTFFLPPKKAAVTFRLPPPDVVGGKTENQRNGLKIALWQHILLENLAFLCIHNQTVILKCIYL